MKFTDGFWMIQKEVEAHFAQEIYDIETTEDSITIYCPDRTVNHRGDTLNGQLLTIKYSSPMSEVIKVNITHFKGLRNKGPEFNITEHNNVKVNVFSQENKVVLQTGRLSVNINKGSYKVDFADDDKILTGTGNKSTAYMKRENDKAYIVEELNLGVGEYVYGMGERFTSFTKNGQVIDIWNRDGGTASEQAYKNIPFYMTNKGYGVFVNHPGAVSFEVASEKVSRVQFSVPGESVEYFIIYGPTPKEVIEKYTALTGRPELPPAWSFGLWLTTSFTTSYDEKTVTDIIDGMAKRDLPLSVFHFDCFWMKEYTWCDFKWDERVFPEPEAMLRRLKDKGLKICVWINPYIAQRSYLFDEGMEKGYLIKRPDGDVWQWDMWQAGMGLVDFTNPDACRWYAEKLEKLLDMGVDCFKTDFGERIPTDVVYYDDSDSEKMHNYYSYLYNKVVFDLLKQKRGEGEAVLFARSATAGGQKFPVHWGGDCSASYESMAESLRGGLSLGLSGFGFWSHDISGFESTATPDIYKRWVAFGMLSSHSRLHGSSSYRVPWLFDEEAVDVLRVFTKLKCRLMPYLYSAACEAAERGIPVMRPMMMEFPKDNTCLYLDRQYMLGENLLVAPIFSEDGYVDYYIPNGQWINYFTGEKIKGGTWVKEKHDYLSIPLLVRPNSIISVGSEERTTDYNFSEDICFHIFGLEDGGSASCKLYNSRGRLETKIRAYRNKDTILIDFDRNINNSTVLLRGIEGAVSVNNAYCEQDVLGLKLVLEGNVDKIIVKLS